MAPGTHALIGWWTANVLPLTRRDRLFVFLAGVLPDLDGLGMFYSKEAYVMYHHVLCHNLLGCVVCAVLIAAVAADRTRCVSLAILNWHLHLACDYFGSRGPPETPPWVLPYLYPFVGSQSGEGFVGPAWYWNPWQWPLDGWPNVLILGLGLVSWVYLAVRLDRTWFEFVWPRMDRELCKTLRKWFGGEPEAWSRTEAAVIWRSYVAVAVTVFFACAVAASRAQ